MHEIVKKQDRIISYNSIKQALAINTIIKAGINLEKKISPL